MNQHVDEPESDLIGKSSLQAWRTVEQEIVFSESFKRLEVQRCLLPNGLEFPRYYIDRYPDWVNVVALTPQKEFILVRQYRHAYGKITLETAAGTLNREETDPVPAARRELLEETGYEPGEMISLGSLSPNPALQDNMVHIYLATDCTFTGSQHLDRHEEIEVVLIPSADIHRAIRENLFEHALALVAILLALNHLGDAAYFK
jgi:ADP-ribose pyrophosphatase